jgi:polysaccharide biosynthesis transport protein
MPEASPESPGSALIRRPENAVQPRPAIAPEAAPPSAFNTKDAIFAIFKHKWLVLSCALLGIIAAVLFYRFYPPLYESQAKLLVRYVVDRSAVDSVDNTSVNSSRDSSAIAAEAEIVSSWDLAVKVAEVIGPQRLLPGQGAANKEQAAAIVSKGLGVTFGNGSNILFVSYKNRDPQLATIVLDELIKQYFIKHLEVHRSSDAFDFVTQQIDRVKAQLNQTEDALIPLKSQLGIISLAAGQAALSAELTQSEGQLHDAEAGLAEQRARLKEIEKANAGGDITAKLTGKSPSPSPPASTSPASSIRPGLLVNEASAASDADLQKYQILVARLEQLRQTEISTLAKYTPSSTQVQQIETQLGQVAKEKLALEAKFPDLPSRLPASASDGTQGGGLVLERVRLAGMEARVTALKTQRENVKERMKQMSEIGPQVAELDRRKELEDANYKYFSGTLEKARVDEALDPSKIPNISAVQKASPPVQVTAARNKETLMIAVGGLGLGLALALLCGLLVDRTLKRPLEVEEQLDISLLLSIPHTLGPQATALSPSSLSPNSSRRQIGSSRQLAPWDPGHFIKPYCEAIRDRISLYFELNQLTHKPKLVGVTSFSKGAGTSTLAAGLAAALSETGEGKVLLVDVNLGPEDVHPFFKGRPAYTLKAALRDGVAMDAASENLYLAKVGSNAGPAQLGLKKFFEMIPNLKASDFDYVVFDMPYLEQTCPAWGMAAFMDKLLVIVEAEKSNRTLVSRGYRKLVAERNNVSVIFNKARSYVPKLLDGEFLS